MKIIYSLSAEDYHHIDGITGGAAGFFYEYHIGSGPGVVYGTSDLSGNLDIIYGSNNELIEFRQLKKEVSCNKKINLSKDLIWPWPWNRSRLINTITNIGNRRAWGQWQQDNNHFVEVWLLLGVAWVHGGNHSIAVGIVQGGELTPEYYYDISDFYKYIKCDGKNFIRTNTNCLVKDKIIGPVINVDLAAIFEIGRLL